MFVVNRFVLRVHGYRQRIDQAFQFGQHVSLVDQVGQAVRVDPHSAALFLDPGGDLLEHLEPQGGFAISAKNDFLVLGWITDTVDDLLHLGTMIQCQVEIVYLEHALGFRAKRTHQGTAVRYIQVQVFANWVGNLLHGLIPGKPNRDGWEDTALFRYQRYSGWYQSFRNH